MSVVAKIGRRLRRKPRFEYRLLMCRGLDESLPLFGSALALETEELAPDLETIELAIASLPSEHRHDVARRLAKGDRCWVARLGSRLVYAVWVEHGSAYSFTLDRRFALDERDVHAYGAYTDPAYRGHGIHQLMMSVVLPALRERGYRRIVSVMEPGNRAALRMPAKLGLRTVGAAGFIELFGVRFHFLLDRGAFPTVRPRHYWSKR